MGGAFRSFMKTLIDYAGLFPPARLELKQALHRYIGHTRGRHSWMLGRFIVTAPQLGELCRLVGQLPPPVDRPVRLCVIIGSGETERESITTVRADLDSVRSELDRCRDTVFVDALEIRFPGETAQTGHWVPWLTDVRTAVGDSGLRGIELFTETIKGGHRSAEETDHSAIEGLAAYAGEFPDDPILRRAGYKIRCGGLEPAAFPSVDRIAGILADCRDHQVAIKCTAGLHHPVRFFDSDLQVRRHGFLNLFGAGVFARALNMRRSEIADCLGDENAGSFRFDGERFLWRDLVATAAQVERGRDLFVTAFGSCSFQEPLDDLRSLGMLKNGSD